MAASKLKILSTPKVGQYDIPGHPEQPARVLRSLEHLKSILPADQFAEPAPAPLEKIYAVHGPNLVADVEREVYFDPDTPGAPGIYDASMLSAGSALQAARECLDGTKVFSLMRPPGHHARPDKAMGFCYFNSMAVAVQDVARGEKPRKIAVFDLDCHHGNGTEDFCFSKKEFLYVSLHQFPAYPGTGRSSRENCINYPLPPGTEEGDYFPAMENAMKRIRDFQPDLVGVSMGFDTYEKDPLTQFGLKKKDYRKIGQWLKQMDLPMFSLLEGGYDNDLPFLIEEFLKGWAE